MNPPKDYNVEHTPQEQYNGTDIYLTCVTVMLTSFIVKTLVTLTLFANELPLNPTAIQVCMAVTSILAGRNCLTMQNNFMYKRRVVDSITEALKTVVIAPFSAAAQIARSTTSGFSFTRNLFD